MKYIPDDKIDEIIKKLAKFRDCDGIGKVIKDLGTGKTNAIGTRYVLEYADNFAPIMVKFEVEELIEITTESGEKLVTRRYNAVIDGVKHEMKCWREWHVWSDKVIIDQLVKDLVNKNIEKLEDLQWIFKRTEGINEKVLYKRVIGALESEAGRKSLQVAVKNNLENFQKLFGNEVLDENDIIEKLKDKSIFNKIFKIYE